MPDPTTPPLFPILRATFTGLDASVNYDALDQIMGDYPRAERPETTKNVGFAGGLGPDTIAARLPEILAVARPGDWVDMETDIRTDDWLDLSKVRAVCRILWPGPTARTPRFLPRGEHPDLVRCPKCRQIVDRDENGNSPRLHIITGTATMCGPRWADLTVALEPVGTGPEGRPVFRREDVLAAAAELSTGLVLDVLTAYRSTP